MMYLSRISIDMRNRNAVQVVAKPHLLHSAIEDCFPRERGRNLWRYDSIGEQSFVLLVSQEKVDLSSVSEKLGGDGKFDTLEYESFIRKLKEDQEWHFRIRANPTKSTFDPNNPNQRGKIVAVKPSDEKDWLISKGADYGFALSDSDFEIKEKGWMKFTKGKERHNVSLYTVVYEGYLRITSIELFSNALQNGIGRGKAYGCGLLTIAKSGG